MLQLTAGIAIGFIAGLLASLPALRAYRKSNERLRATLEGHLAECFCGPKKVKGKKTYRTMWGNTP